MSDLSLEELLKQKSELEGKIALLLDGEVHTKNGFLEERARAGYLVGALEIQESEIALIDPTKKLETLEPVVEKPTTAKFTAKVGDVWKHKKRNVECVILNIGALQVEENRKPLTDMEPLIVYTHEGNVWVRPVDEFHDGRFEKVE